MSEAEKLALSCIRHLWECISEMSDGHIPGDPVPTGYLTADESDLLKRAWADE